MSAHKSRITRVSPASPTSTSRRDALKKTAAMGVAAAAGSLGFPALVRAQADTIKIGHLTPRTGFLGQLGQYGLRGTTLAIDEVNASGGVLGRKVDLLAEDSVTPQAAVTKAQKLIERDKVACLLGEISSASALAIGDVAGKARIVYINTGANSDALRGSNCNRYMFHVEGCNTMYTKTIGTWQKQQNLIKGAKWYFLTADYAFGHDLYKVSSRFLQENGGVILGNDMVPTNSPDYSAYILKIRNAKPDFVYINLAGVDQTTFLKQYKEYGLTVPQAVAFTKKFVGQFGYPPDNQAWGDYVAAKILTQAIAEAKSTDSVKLVEYFEKGPSFDILKARKGTFRKWDHQLLQEMYVVKVKDKTKMKDKWDIFDIVQPVPGANESLELIQPTQAENPCKMA